MRHSSSAPLVHLMLGALFSACAANTTPTASLSEDERTNAGVPNAALDYCKLSGGTVTDAAAYGGACKFSDGSLCDAWAFYRAECGGPQAYCTKHGGVVARKEENKGTWTSVYAQCTLKGASCTDYDYAKKGTCP